MSALNAKVSSARICISPVLTSLYAKHLYVHSPLDKLSMGVVLFSFVNFFVLAYSKYSIYTCFVCRDLSI